MSIIDKYQLKEFGRDGDVFYQITALSEKLNILCEHFGDLETRLQPMLNDNKGEEDKNFNMPVSFPCEFSRIISEKTYTIRLLDQRLVYLLERLEI